MLCESLNFPPLLCAPLLQSNNIMRRFDYAHSIMRRIGRQSIADKKASMAVAPDEKNTIPCGSSQNRVLLTLLMKANMASEGPRLSDEDVIARESPFPSLKT